MVKTILFSKMAAEAGAELFTPVRSKPLILQGMRTLLTTLNAKYIHTNLAIRILHEQNAHRGDVSFREFTIKGDFDAIAQECAQYSIVAFSCYIWNITQTLDVCKRIKVLNPACTIVLGGPEVSYEYEPVIALPFVDYIIQGEGEIPFSAFLDAFPNVDDVPSLVFVRDGRTVTNPLSPAFDVNRFSGSMPYRYDDPETLRSKVLYIETSRGCPYKCGFCLASLDNRVRYLPQDTIEATLLFLMKNGRTIKFLDRTFNMKRDFTLRIFRFILDNHSPGNVFQFEITADILHPDIIAFIRQHVPRGLFRFEIGIQTVNQAANLAVKRRQDFAKTRAIIEQVRDKVELHLDLIVGLPHDTMQEIRRSFTEVFMLHPPELQLGFLKFLKGTPMRDEAGHGYVYHDTPPYEIIRSNYLSEADLDQVRRLEAALEIYWNGGKAVNTLRYISHHDDVFDVLCTLGEAVQSKPTNDTSLTGAYDLLDTFCSERFPDSHFLKELIALDYYTHFKVAPSPRFVLPASSTKKGSVRELSVPFTFDVGTYIETGEVILAPTLVHFCYNALEKASLRQEAAIPA
jgi:anaerobic magnesium-protoporphyrin IX monomethyl ester cyclase